MKTMVLIVCFAVSQFAPPDCRRVSYPEPLSTDYCQDIRDGPEIITVTPPEGWIAMPSRLNVVDGETGTIEIVRGEYLGS